MPRKPTKVWKITGYNSLDTIFEATLPLAYSEGEITRLLQRLAARHLTNAEVLSASLRKNSKARTGHLDVHRDSGPDHFHLMTTGNPYYTARTAKGGREDGSD